MIIRNCSDGIHAGDTSIGTQYVLGFASGTIVSRGGTVASGVTSTISSGIIASNTTILSGGMEILLSDATALGGMVSTGGVLSDGSGILGGILFSNTGLTAKSDGEIIGLLISKPVKTRSPRSFQKAARSSG